MKKKPKFKMNIATLSIVLAALVSVGMIVKGAMYQPAISAHEKRKAEIQESIEYEKQRIKEIDEVTEKVGTDEYTEKVAREKLGMIKFSWKYQDSNKRREKCEDVVGKR